MTIAQIARETLLELQKSDRLDSPQAYRKIFCKKAQEAGVILEDCQKVEQVIARLDGGLARQIKERNIREPDDLLIFLSSYLNRQKPDQIRAGQQAVLQLLKQVLSIAQHYPHKSLQMLAFQTLQKLDESPPPEELKNLTQRWKAHKEGLRWDKIEAFKARHKLTAQDVEELFAFALQLGNESIPDRLLVPLEWLEQEMEFSIANLEHDRLTIVNDLREKVKNDRMEQAAEQLAAFHKKRLVMDRYECQEKTKKLESILVQMQNTVESLQQKLASAQESLKRHGIGPEVVEENFEPIQLDVDAVEQHVSDAKIELIEEEEVLEDETNFFEPKEQENFEIAQGKIELDFSDHRKNYHLVSLAVTNLDEITMRLGQEAAEKASRSLEKLFKRYASETPFEVIDRKIIALIRHGKNPVRYVRGFNALVKKSRFQYKHEEFTLVISTHIVSRNSYLDPESMLDDLLAKPA